MPVDVLETTWSVGRNRRVELAHVWELKEAFMKGGLERSAPENRIAVLCSVEDVSGSNAEDNEDNDKDVEAAFLRWPGVNDTKAEVMAGQHQLCALREYVVATGAPASEAWWTCELYDKDRLPAELNIKLRINRRDPSLPDNHGQIWAQLVSIASDAAGAVTRNQATVDHKLVEALRLGGEKSFPTRRLTRLGLETFNISTFKWIASLWINDYWFATLEAALGMLEALPVDKAEDLGQEDWNRLAAALQGGGAGDGAADAKGRTREAVEAVFYTGDGSGGRSHRRAASLLKTVDDATYRQVCRVVWTSPDLAFVNLKRVLRSKRPEMEAAVRVLHHVIGWIHRESAIDLENVNPKSKNKPQLLHHLQTALDGLHASRGVADGCPGDAALRLQRRVLDFARRSADAFWAPEAQTLLGDGITSVEDAAYGKRFEHALWAQLLRIVRQITDRGNDGHVLRPHWQAANGSKRGLYRAQVSTLVAAFCAKLLKLGGQSVGKNDPSVLALQRSVKKVLAVSAHEDENGVDEEDDDDGTLPPPPPPPRRPDPAGAGTPPSAQKTWDREAGSGNATRPRRSKSPGLFLSDHDDNDDDRPLTPPPPRQAAHHQQQQRQAAVTSSTAASAVITTPPVKKPRAHWKMGPRAGSGGRR
ncbi:hypothetical protein LX36DRAFT_705307 [Colletotrichum falcatum]|nr:hypothetical protein LX36DRAFT_705307 [Colletotrichum falcatum]